MCAQDLGHTELCTTASAVHSLVTMCTARCRRTGSVVVCVVVIKEVFTLCKAHYGRHQPERSVWQLCQVNALWVWVRGVPAWLRECSITGDEQALGCWHVEHSRLEPDAGSSV